jgi:hypothetical protein
VRIVPDIRLVDLEVIKRYSLAVRTDTVPAEELLEALDASRAFVLEMTEARKPVVATRGGRIVRRTAAAAASKPTRSRVVRQPAAVPVVKAAKVRVPPRKRAKVDAEVIEAKLVRRRSTPEG